MPVRYSRYEITILLSVLRPLDLHITPSYTLQHEMRAVDILAVLSLAIGVVDALPQTQAVHLPIPTRELEWKDVNFLSISDTHGKLVSSQID